MITFNFNPYHALKSIVQVTSAHMGKEYLKVICDELKILFDAQKVFITEAIDSNPTTKVRILYSTDPNSAKQFNLEGTPCKLVYENQIIQITKGLNIDFEQEFNTDYESFYGIPIHNNEDKCIGHIAIFSDKIRELPREVEDIALIFSRRIETEYERIILEEENKKIMDELFNLTIIDPLTNVYNRRFFTEKCSEVFTQVNRDFTKASIIFLDLDDFKTINDNFGHETGDYVLKKLGSIFKSTCRKDVDFISRIGGEEFGIICLNSDIQNSVELATRIMKKTHEFFLQKDYKVTFSIGIEKFDSSYKSWEEVYNLADNKMYKAKRSGKNKIVY